LTFENTIQFIRHPGLLARHAGLDRSVGPPVSIHDGAQNIDVNNVLMDPGSEAGMTVAE